MKIRHLAGTLLATAALSLPAVAHAATYQPFNQSDPAYDAETAPNEPSNAGIDITNVRGFRNDAQISVATKFRNLKRVNYSRRIVALIDPSGSVPTGRLVEFRTGPKGAINVALYTLDFKNETYRQITCAGVRAVPDAATDKLTVVLPVACYPGAKKDGAIVISDASVYTAETWTPGPLSNDSFGPADESDDVYSQWQWTGGVQMKQLKKQFHLF